MCRSLLDKVLAGEIPAWTGFIRFIGHDPGQGSRHCLDGSIESQWGWQFLGPEDRDKAATAALHYLRHTEVALGDWWTVPHQHDYGALAGYRALELLLQSNPPTLESLPANAWENWAPVIVRTDLNEDEETGRRRQLLARCHEAIPARLRSRLKERMFLLAGSEGGRVAFNGLLGGLWDDEIGALVAETLTIPSLSPDSLGEGLRLLLEHDHPSAATFIDDAISGTETGDRRLAILAVALCRDHGRYWRDVWPVIASEDDFGRQVLNCAVGDGFLSEMTALTECDLADLYLFLCQTLPDDLPRTGYGFHELPFLRDRLPGTLADKGTEAACRKLERIRDTLPNGEWISHYLIKCREQLRRNTWRPVEPKALVDLAASRDRRFVRDGAELLDVVVESLKRFESHLHGSGHQLDEVWNTARNGRSHQYSPKDELEFCRAVHRHLCRDLEGRRIVVNREVELCLGERTDIHVNAVVEGNRGDILTVVVEAKGCWHDDVMTAMKSQLVDRYMGDWIIQHGIYLVGWFLCESWKNSGDNRYWQALRLDLTIDSARTKLDQQARTLSGDGRDVRAFILDARWPGDGGKPKTPKKMLTAPLAHDP